MRVTPTPAERMLWERVRNRALGVRFRRQHAIGRFIVDFCCLEARLVVEVDGSIHAGRAEPDAERDAHLAERGLQVLRFSNAAVLSDIDAVVESIRIAISVRTTPDQRKP
jgi:very-short-patch-repair endonuclease